MSASIMKLFPIDGFRISKKGAFTEDIDKSLTHLYQPIIGRLAVSLFQTLRSEYDMVTSEKVQTHHTLMSYLSSPLDKIYEARIKLEAIGLLRTYRSTLEEQTEYVYVLHSPFSSSDFFKDDMLSLLLEHELGEEKFTQLKERLVQSDPLLDGFEEVTETFDHVYHAGSNVSSLQRGEKKTQNVSKGPLIEQKRVDFDWLHQALKQRMYVSEKILTGTNKRIIAQLASLYDLTSYEIEKALIWAIDDQHKLVLDEFKSACHDFMKEKPQKPSHHIDLRQKVKTDEDQEQESQKSKSDQFVDMLEQISPRELLEDLSNGNKATDQDLKIIRDVMTEQGLQPGVMNVLVHYVLLKTDMKLSKPYLEKIAGHWTRKNVTTVRQAMNLAKAEHQKYQQWGKQKASNRRSHSEEVIPAWFHNQTPAKPAEPAQKAANADELAQRIQRLTNKSNGR